LLLQSLQTRFSIWWVSVYGFWTFSCLPSAGSVQIHLRIVFLFCWTKNALYVSGAGFPDYGVSVNLAKTRVSFELSAGGRRLPRNTVRSADGQEFMPWCGLLLNTATLDLQADYTRYAGSHLASSLTIPLTKVSPQPALLTIAAVGPIGALSDPQGQSFCE
jgi:hypothetical protein